MSLDPDHFLDLLDGKFQQTSADDLRNLFVKARDAEHLVLHFHGGLVSRIAAAAGAMELIDTYRAGGAYPIFFVWNSDLPSTIKGSWDEIAKEKAFQRLVRRLIQLALGKLQDRFGRGDALQLESMRVIPADLTDVAKLAEAREPMLNREVGELSPEQIAQVEDSLQQDDVLREESAAIAMAEQQTQGRPIVAARDGMPAVVPKTTRMSAGVREDVRQDFFVTPGEPVGRGVFLLTLAKHGAAILINVIRRYITHRDHRLYTTVVEEVLRKLYVDSLGQLAWDLMKKDTLDAFGDDAESCGGTACVRHLAAWWKPGRRITLVGHSTGAIYIGNLLVAADKALSASVPFEVVFLAPACTFDFMYERLPVYRRRVGDRIRQFGLGEAREQGYFEVPVLYQGSLLYMVSGLFEMTEIDKEVIGMERYHRNVAVYGDRDVSEVRAYLEPRLAWSPSDTMDGWRTAAPRHGGFTGDALTRSSLQHILRRGFA